MGVNRQTMESSFNEKFVRDAIRTTSDEMFIISKYMHGKDSFNLLPFEKRLLFIEKNILSAYMTTLSMHLSFLENANLEE